jgi:ferrous-iron efflux pump FieF
MSKLIVSIGDLFFFRVKHKTLVRWATFASTFVAIVLIAFKAWAFWLTGSLSLQASLIDSCLDAFASIINMVAVYHALKPADDNHRFGHGKAESLAALGQSLFILGSALWLLREVYVHFIHPETLENTATGIFVMVLSIVMTTFLVAFQKYVITKSKSPAIQADSLHYQTDILINGSVCIALILGGYFGIRGADEVLGALIGLYILYSVVEIIITAVNVLMDHECSDEIRSQIKEVVRAHPQILGAHDLRTRHSGTTIIVQLHIELDERLTLKEAHAITEDLEMRIIAALGDAEVLIHQDPRDTSQGIAFHKG